MLRIVFILFSIICSLVSSAQVLKGQILNLDGEPVPYATVYIHEITLGIVADEQGKFQTHLNAGTYTCEIRSLGYESQTKTINVPATGTEFQIKLEGKALTLKEVIVSPSKEDPAYRIMRHAIAWAPIHLYQVSYYNSENYLKGSAKIEKIPGLMKMMITDNKIKSLIGKLLVMESKNEITFQSPSKYTQRVIAYKSSIPKEMEPKGGFRVSPSNIYEANYLDKVSPLSPHAFRYYNFKLEDVFTNGNYQVNKIKIIPKLKSENLFSGYLYILEDNWSVFSLDLTYSDMGTTTHIKRNYQEVKPTVFIPITYETNTDIGTMGVKGYARYYSSVKYNSIKLNESLAKINVDMNPEKTVTPVTEKQQKTRTKIEELSAKDKITTREALKLSRLMTLAAEPKELREQKEALEIKDIPKVALEIDSLATQRDSTFWETIRNVPLLKDEAESFRQKDTLPPSKSVNSTNNSISISMESSNKLWKWLLGGNIDLGTSTKLYYDGLISGLLNEYNFADGAWLGQKLTLSISTSKTNNLTISPAAYYITARKSVVWNINSQYNYAPMSLGKLSLTIGNTSEDIQADKGTSRLFNSISSLFFGDNVVRFYQKKYLSLDNGIDISNGLRLNIGVAYENRQLLNNHTTYHFFGKTPQPNYPDQAYSDAFPTHSATNVRLKLEYTPFYKYMIKDGKKEYVSSVYPTFILDYKKAIPLFKVSEQSSYDKIDLSVHQKLTLTEFDKLSYRLAFGAFLTKQKLYAPDFNYFTTSPLFISNRSFDDGFNLLDNYTYNNNRWLEMQLNWTSNYLLLKRIGFLQTAHFDEALQAHTLWTLQNEKPYTEIGYSIGINNLGRIGVFSAFNGLDFKSVGLKVSITLFSNSGKR